METITIPKKEYEKLKSQSVRLKLIDTFIHEDLPLQEMMNLQEKQESLDFLKNKDEDGYTLSDLSEIWKKE